MTGKYTVLCLEQALTLPYATERFAQLGWRVIRIESPAVPGKRAGDPNRYIGEDTGVDDLHAYFIAPNMGKEAITINLKEEAGRQVLRKIICELKVDVFMCNTLPKRYQQLGIDYESLSAEQPGLIWCGISAFGPEYPDRAGYDPALQAMLGYMYLTGEPDRDPMLCGLPIIDLKAGDEAFAQVLLAIAERAENGKGKRIDISMARCAASWLITAMPQCRFAQKPEDIFTRSGNEHRSFVPSNAYPTRDGHVYLAIGSDGQWQKLSTINGFEHLDKRQWQTNNNRKQDKEKVYAAIRKGLENYTTADFIKQCLAKGLSVAPVLTVQECGELPAIKTTMVQTRLPGGTTMPLFPAPMTTEYLQKHHFTMDAPPRLGEHTEQILSEAGYDSASIQQLKANGMI